MERPEKRAVAGLPDDPLLEILSRVSFKDLHRSKCVSKGWRDLIDDHLHRKKLPQTLEGFFHGGIKNYGSFVDLSGRSVPLVDPTFSFLTNLLPGTEHFKLLDSCNGLLFEQSRYPDTLAYVVCNPATEQLVAVPTSGCARSRNSSWNSFLMFDPSVSSHFHLIQFCDLFAKTVLGLGVAEVHIYSSESGEWRDRTTEWRAGEEGGEWVPWGGVTRVLTGCTFFNNMLHLIISRLDIYGEPQDMIVAVDGEGKICKIIRWGQDQDYPVFIGQSQGQLFCISVRCRLTSALSIWILKDNNAGEWVLKHRVGASELFEKLDRGVDLLYNVVAIHPDRSVVFLVAHGNQKMILMSYDMDNMDVHALQTFSSCSFEVAAIPYVPYFSNLPVLTNKD